MIQVDGFRTRCNLGGCSRPIDFADGDRLQIKPLLFPGLVNCMYGDLSARNASATDSRNRGAA